MIVYMEHPMHGTHIAYSSDEVAACEANGWKVRRAKVAPAPPAIVEPPVAEPIEEPVEPPRRGRPRRVN